MHILIHIQEGRIPIETQPSEIELASFDFLAGPVLFESGPVNLDSHWPEWPVTSRCSLLSPENAPFDEFIFSIKFCEIFQGFIKKFQGFSRVSRDFQGFKHFPGFSRISRARTIPAYLSFTISTANIRGRFRREDMTTRAQSPLCW